MAGLQFTDTTDFFSIDYDDKIIIGDKCYIVRGHERERRFGIDDPKFWVKRVYDSETGENKILKLSYLETFEMRLGDVKIRCFRNPEKESKILELVKGHPYFMQGRSYLDVKGNNVRVLDVVRGTNLFVYIDGLNMTHEEYFNTIMPAILRKLIDAFEAICFLHTKGFKHGDIRNDHVIIEAKTGNYVWIDFDFDYDTPENPFSLDIFGLGNLLLCTIGKGFHNLHMIHSDTSRYGDLIDHLEGEDFSILDKWRLMNLRKLYPYIPKTLNDILLHFSRGTNVYYEYVLELIEDLTKCLIHCF